MSVPRLADFSYANKASLISPLVVRGLYRAFEGLVVCLAGFAIAQVYVDEPLVHANPYYWAAQ